MMLTNESQVASRRWEQVRNLLCIRLDSMGDVLMTTPAIRALRSLPAVERLTLMTSPAGADIAGMVPEIDDVLCHSSIWMKHTSPQANGESEWDMIERLRECAFDAAVIFSVFSQNPLPAAFMCHLADIPLRLAHCRENPYQLLSDWIPEVEPEKGIRHEVLRQVELVQSVGAHSGDLRLSLAIPESTRAIVREEVHRMIGRHRRWIAVHPGATAASRRYPIERFAAVAGMLADAGYAIVLTGSGSDRELADVIESHVGDRAVSLVGKLNLAELAAWIEHAPVLLTNNTGPAHIAAALGTPVVDLYALTNPQHTPWLVAQRVLFHDVPCKYCFKSICPEGHHHCLRQVTPEAVVHAVLDLWQETADRPPPSELCSVRSAANDAAGRPSSILPETVLSQ